MLISKHFNAIDIGGYDSDVIFTVWLYKLNTPELIEVNRAQFRKGTDFKRDSVEFMGNNYYILTSSNCFIWCLKFLTGKDFTDEFSTFIRSE